MLVQEEDRNFHAGIRERIRFQWKKLESGELRKSEIINRLSVIQGKKFFNCNIFYALFNRRGGCSCFLVQKQNNVFTCQV